MPWNARLRHPVRLSNGATLRTLGDARDFVLSLPARVQLRPQWQSLAGLLVSCAHSVNPTLIALVTDRVHDALRLPGAVRVVDGEKMPDANTGANSVRRIERRH
jgi:hypothetical protein